MDVRVEEKPAIRAAGLRHTGPYDRINEAFQRLGKIAGRTGLFAQPEARMIAIYHDAPEAVPPEERRSEAAITISEGATIPDGLTEQRVPAGRFATTIHVGPYERLPDTWAQLREQWIPANGVRLRGGDSYEVYLNDPSTTRPEDLRTEICVAVA